MTLPLYLAMTAAEISAATALPPKTAYMACHYSAYTTGLSNLPQQLPEGCMLIVNDRIPVHGHDPKRIAEQLAELVEKLKPDGVLLDFQRQESQVTPEIIKHILDTLSCPVGITEHFARAFPCPVFLSPPPLYQPLTEYIAPWTDRELWLEAAPDCICVTVTESGSFCSPSAPPAEPLPFCDDRLHCRYQAQVTPEQLRFTLQRSQTELSDLLKEAQEIGITRAIGLYQELSSFMCDS